MIRTGTAIRTETEIELQVSVFGQARKQFFYENEILLCLFWGVVFTAKTVTQSGTRSSCKTFNSSCLNAPLTTLEKKKAEQNSSYFCSVSTNRKKLK